MKFLRNLFLLCAIGITATMTLKKINPYFLILGNFVFILAALILSNMITDKSEKSDDKVVEENSVRTFKHAKKDVIPESSLDIINEPHDFEFNENTLEKENISTMDYLKDHSFEYEVNKINHSNLQEDSFKKYMDILNG